MILLRRQTTLSSRLLFRTRLHEKLSCRCTTATSDKSSTVRRQTKSHAAVIEPTHHQLYIVALHQAIPFVGFGIMDNAILILAGEVIDVYLGAALGLSTMCAAAIGNIISNWVRIEQGVFFSFSSSDSAIFHFLMPTPIPISISSAVLD